MRFKRRKTYVTSMFDESANVLEIEVPPDSERRRCFDLKTPTDAELLRDSPTDEDQAIWLKALRCSESTRFEFELLWQKK